VAADSDLGSAAADLAVGPALLRSVAQVHDAQGELRRPKAVDRLAADVPAGANGRLLPDGTPKAPNYCRAVAGAQAHGFQPAVRSPGGRAARTTGPCLCFELVLPDAGERNPVQPDVGAR
jgi:hypothetical protein